MCIARLVQELPSVKDAKPVKDLVSTDPRSATRIPNLHRGQLVHKLAILQKLRPLHKLRTLHRRRPQTGADKPQV